MTQIDTSKKKEGGGGGGGGGLAGSQPLVGNIPSSVGAITPQTGSLVARSSPLIPRPIKNSKSSNDSVTESSARPLLESSSNAVSVAPVLDHPLADPSITTTSKATKSEDYAVDIYALVGVSDEIEVIRSSPSNKIIGEQKLHQRQSSGPVSIVVPDSLDPSHLEPPIAAAPISMSSSKIKSKTVDTHPNVAVQSHVDKSLPSISLTLTLDEEADDFLKGNELRDKTISEELVGMQLLHDFEKRRGWSDILAVSIGSKQIIDSGPFIVFFLLNIFIYVQDLFGSSSIA